MSSTEKQPTFEQMPALLLELFDKVEHFTDLINTKFAALPSEQPKDVWMNLEELQEYLPDHPKRSNICTWGCNRQIPFYKKLKRLSFLRSEIDNWLLESGHATASSLRSTALETHGYRKGGLR